MLRSQTSGSTCRPSEAHLDEPKTERSRRTITLPASVTEALRGHRKQQAETRLAVGAAWANDWELVFCNEIGGPLAGEEVTRRFQRKLAELGLPRQRFHDLRHAAGSFMLAQGASLSEVMEVLGHSTITTTANVYMHVLPQLKKETADRMEALLYGTG
jgi:integrase